MAKKKKQNDKENNNKGKSKKNQPEEAAVVKDSEITEELQESYLDYAMSVIVSRALPDIRDGLKPVQRRILWAMWNMGLTSGARFVKSSRVTGEVLGKFHPHGDMAVYDTMVRMAQDFSLRYPLVDGQGNFGNIDGDNAAAQRYTEARMEGIADEMLKDIEKETVEWRDNYDNTRKEPVYLPAKLPNLILNGTMGIAVGMATNIPPHNLNEIADASIHLIKNPNAGAKDLMKFVPAPDFPTGGIIYAGDSLEEAYTTGKGSITIRAVTDIEEKKGGGFKIVITEIPYQVVKSNLISKIASLVQDKKIEGIKNIQDESDREGLRVVIELKQATNPQRILNQLFKHTDLQKKFYFNMLALVDGIQPQVVSLKDIISAHIEHRKIVVRRRTEFGLKKAEEKAHILEGLAKALKEIDAVIATIKKSKDKETAHANLMKKFKLTDVQASAILDMKLQTLASLETQKINDELKEKKKLIAELKDILAKPEKILDILIEEFEGLKEKYGDERKTQIAKEKIKQFKQEDFIPRQEAVVIITDDGYIKRLSPGSFRSQRRGGKGLIGFDLKEEDKVDKLLLSNTHDNILFFTDSGKVFQTKVYEIPESKRTSKGKIVHSFLGLLDSEKITAVVSYPNEEKGLLVMVTEQGIIKSTKLGDFGNVRKNGIIAMNLKKKDVLRWVRLASDKDEVFIVTMEGQSIRFSLKDVRTMGRTASGVKAIKLKKGDKVAGVDIIESREDIKGIRALVVMEKGFGKQTPIEDYKVQHRGGGGIRTAKVTGKTGKIIAAYLVSEKENEEILAFSAKGHVIRTKLKDIRMSGRSTQGVRIMNLAKDDSLVGVICL